LKDAGFVVWFCGLPGSGKTTIARGVFETLQSSSALPWTLISMDSVRQKIFPKPTYSDEERDAAYRALVLAANLLSQNSVSVILDAVGHKKIWRDLARGECPRFYEIYVKCPAEICVARETQRKDESSPIRTRLYLDAMDRLRTGKKIEGLGKVPGVDEPFEESDSPEIVLDSSTDPPGVLVERTFQELARIAPEIFSLNKKAS
jgi:adenylylsulfate kinase-like enzyme